MSTLNSIIPPPYDTAECSEGGTNKFPHRWLPTGQTTALLHGHVAIECYCKHCNDREWGTVSAIEFIMISEYWTEL